MNTSNVIGFREPLTLNLAGPVFVGVGVKSFLFHWKQSNVSTIWLAVWGALFLYPPGQKISAIVRIEQKIYSVSGTM